MKKLAGLVAALSILAIIYMLVAASANWDWGTAALVLASAMALALVLFGLTWLTVWGFMGDHK